MQYKCPLIVVGDMKISRAFYEKVMGQKVLMDFGANLTFSGEFSLQTKDSWLEFIEKEKDDTVFQTNNFELYFEEENLDEFINKLNTFDGIEYVHGIKEFPWGQRVIRFYDPDKHIIEVGESMKTVIERFFTQGLSIEEIANITQHPIEFVRKCL